MRRFSEPIDLRSRHKMTDYLRNHFRYSTMNSWNHATSYACNLKIYRLGLEPEIESKLYDMLDTQEFLLMRQETLYLFNVAHKFLWQAGFNGRNGGYLVLYQGDLKPSEYRSYCTCCGQRNCRSVADTDNLCGVCGNPTRVDYRIPPKKPIIYPGRSTDMDDDYEEWSLSDLRNRVKLVQELDSLADELVSQAIHMVNAFDVVEENFYVPQTQRVLVAKE